MKTKKTPVLRAVSSAPDSDELTLTPDEMRIIRAYRRAHTDAQELMLHYAENFSAECPRSSSQSALRLIAGGAA